MKSYKNLNEEDLEFMRASRLKKAVIEFERIERQFTDRLRGEYDYSEESWLDFFEEGNDILTELVDACRNVVNAVNG